MKIEIKKNTKVLEACLRDMAKLTGSDFRSVVEYETERILDKTVRGVKAADISKIRTNHESRDFGMHKTTYQPKTSFKGTVSKNGFKRYFYHNRYPKALWDEISKQRKASLQNKLKKRGMARRSFLLLAEKLGFSLKVPAFVSRAEGPTGPHPENVIGERRGKGKDFSIYGENRSPLAPWTGMAYALNRAIVGRIGYFRSNLKRGVFKSLDLVAKKYPGAVTITPYGN